MEQAKPVLELKISNRKRAQLDVVKKRAAMRTNRRIQIQLEEAELKKIEAEQMRNVPEDEVVVGGASNKKG